LKFTPVEKAVGLRTYRGADGGAVISVWDEGIGIAADKIEQVTKPFYQAESALVKRYSGTGLGLAIVEALVRGHGGAMTIASVEGEGATFEIHLPPERVLAADAPELRAAS
jgi:signal transduction histidine kinase